MRDQHQPQRYSSFTNHMSKGQVRGFTLLESTFHEKTLRPHFPYSMVKDRELKSLSEAKDRVYLFSIKTLSQTFEYMSGEERGRPNKPKFDFDNIYETLSSSGMGPLNLRASDPEARILLTTLTIKHMLRLKKKFEANAGAYFNFLTFICDSGVSDHTAPDVDILAFKEKVQAVIRKFSNEHAIGFIEIQPLRIGNTYLLMVNVHLVTFGVGWTDREMTAFKKKCKRFKTSLSNHEIIRKRMPKTNNMFARNGSYISKLPGKYKTKSGDGRLSRTEEMPGYLLARHFEILSQIPLESMMFSVGEGSVVRTEILRDLKSWDTKHRPNRKEVYRTNREIRKFWDEFWKSSSHQNYEPCKVRYKR